jgi:hypothetical protein
VPSSSHFIHIPHIPKPTTPTSSTVHIIQISLSTFFASVFFLSFFLIIKTITNNMNDSADPMHTSSENVPQSANQATSQHVTFNQQLVEEIVTTALMRQAQSYEGTFQNIHTEIAALKLRNVSASQSGNQINSAQPSSSTAKANPGLPVNKRTPLLAKAAAASDKRQALRAQSEPPTIIKTPTRTRDASQKSVSKAPTPSPVKRPNQMVTADFPVDFKSTKVCPLLNMQTVLVLINTCPLYQECLFVHIRLLWGLLETTSVPPPADPEHIRIFSKFFSTVPEVERYITDSNSAALITHSDILTLKDARAGRTKVGKIFIHIDDGHIGYIHAYLAKAGIRCWGPNLDEGPESLFNSACRISALISFQQIGIAGGYNFLGYNKEYKDDMLLLIRTYNHYVHHVLAQKYQAECKNPGKYEDTVQMRNASRNRSRVSG